MKRDLIKNGSVRTFATFAISMAILFGTASCDKSETTLPYEQEESIVEKECSFRISLVPQTRATGAGHGVQSDDNIVNKVEFFIFRNEGEDSGNLDTYKKIEGDELVSLTDISITSTTGAKKIYVVANSHITDWGSISTISDFESKVSMLNSEQIKDFTMIGNAEVTLQSATDVTIPISRLVARVLLSGISTNFAGTPYEGEELSNVKVYLINANGEKRYIDGADDATPVIFNSKSAVADDIASFGMANCIYDEITQPVTDAGYTTEHYFYCYENMAEEENDDVSFTRLVVQADLCGTTYYYPVNINREGFGHTGESDHAGVRSNTSYSLNITITRPGSLEPDDILEYGALSVDLNVADWITIPVVMVNF